jgi:hypothetical protein
MKKLSIALTILVAMSFAALGCGEDGDGCTAGTLNCACATGNTCNTGLVCNPATNKCEAQAACCTAGSGMVRVSGGVRDVTTQSGVVVSLGPVTPLGFISGSNTTPVTTTTSAASGAFTTDCFDASGIGLGLVVLADDEGFDGTGGTYFPTGTGVKAWTDDINTKVCVEEAVVFAVPNTMVNNLGALPGFDSTKGFVLGFVMNASRQPVAEAVVKKADGTEFTTIYYPNPTFTDFTGTSTSATGMFLIPGALTLVGAKPEKAGLTWQASQVAAVPNYCYMSMMIAD